MQKIWKILYILYLQIIFIEIAIFISLLNKTMVFKLRRLDFFIIKLAYDKSIYERVVKYYIIII